jgi:hypothetical protein
VQALAVIGLVAYLLSWLLWPIYDDWYGWGEALKYLSGFEALSRLNNSVKYAVPEILGALVGYVFLALVIVSSKKPS